MVKLFKSVISTLVKSKKIQKLIKIFLIETLEIFVKQTDNTLDDQAVDFIKARLYPNSSRGLQ
tara:strand:+ start:51 stop:239 length:189 start_codon:yes stop_codon:yes gene_type:complete